MVIEAPSSRPSHSHTGNTVTVQPVTSLCLAHPLDRLAAAVVDWLVVILPILLALFAPLKRIMIEAMLVEDTELFSAMAVASLGLGFGLTWVYQTISIYTWGGTLGHRMFGVRVVSVWGQSRPNLAASALRSIVLLLELALMGLPLLSIFSDHLRRPLHDKWADTVAISMRAPGAAGPRPFESSLVHGIYAAFLAVALLGASVFGFEVMQSIQAESQVNDILSGSQSELHICEAVSESLSGKDEPTLEDRLNQALTLFAAGLIDKRCLEREADGVLNSGLERSPAAYLAKSFVHSDDPELSNSYLSQVCKVGPLSEACLMTSVVREWAADEWGKVSALFAAMPEPASEFVRIWQIRLSMKRGEVQGAMGLLDTLEGRGELAPFLVSQRVKGQWRMGEWKEARHMAATAYETLPEPDRGDLAGWMCFEELFGSCGATQSLSCRVLSEVAEAEPEAEWQTPGALALTMLKEKCGEPLKVAEYAERREIVKDQALRDFYRALESWAKGNRQAARQQLVELVGRSDLDESLRAEGLRRLLAWVEKDEQLLEVARIWKGQSFARHDQVGVGIYRQLALQGMKSQALDLGRELLDRYPMSPIVMPEMIVGVYRTGQRKLAYQLLRKYERSNLSVSGRTPASEDWQSVAERLRQEFDTQ